LWAAGREDDGRVFSGVVCGTLSDLQRDHQEKMAMIPLHRIEWLMILRRWSLCWFAYGGGGEESVCAPCVGGAERCKFERFVRGGKPSRSLSHEKRNTSRSCMVVAS